MNLFAYCGNNPVMGYDPEGTWNWGKFWQGVGRVVTGIGAVVAGALVIASGVALVPMLIVAGVTIVAGALTVINGTADIQESITGDNFVKDGIFQGNETAYNWYAGITEAVAIVGSMVCGGWLKANKPRIQAYKNIDKYAFSDTLSKSDHMARTYQQSTLLQKNIIKYGKMVIETKNRVSFSINGSFKIGWVSYGLQKVGSHPITWKLVVDTAKQIIMHIGG